MIRFKGKCSYLAVSEHITARFRLHPYLDLDSTAVNSGYIQSNSNSLNDDQNFVNDNDFLHTIMNNKWKRMMERISRCVFQPIWKCRALDAHLCKPDLKPHAHIIYFLILLALKLRMAFDPSLIPCFFNSPGSTNLVAVFKCHSLNVFSLPVISRSCLASEASLSIISITKSFMIPMDFLVMPMSGWVCVWLMWGYKGVYMVRWRVV